MIKRVTIIFAEWCPHCVPVSLDNAKKMADELGVPLRILDIDVPSQLREADELVENHGDWSDDYTIPQVFVEYESGRITHVFTGFPEGVSVTANGWKEFFSSSYYQSLLREKHDKVN